jgi:metal-sulfur cluster biosynthetic enzyme
VICVVFASVSDTVTEAVRRTWALGPRTCSSGGGRRRAGRIVYARTMPTTEDVVEALKQVEDPELGMDIVELGLFYGAEVEGAKVKVVFTLTSMGCPVGPMIQEDIDRVISEIPGVEEVESELTFDPPWTPEKMSEDAKFILGFG